MKVLLAEPSLRKGRVTSIVVYRAEVDDLTGVFEWGRVKGLPWKAKCSLLLQPKPLRKWYETSVYFSLLFVVVMKQSHKFYVII